MKNILEEIKKHYPSIEVEDALAVYGMIALLKDGGEKEIREIFQSRHVIVDKETEDIISMAKSILTFHNLKK